MFYVVKSVKEVLSSRLFQSCPNPLFQSEAKCEGIEKEMTLCSHQINLIFACKVLHLASF